MTLRRLALTFFLLLSPFSSQAQTIQNPQAVALATQALVALTGTTQVNDITLTGTAIRTAGSDVENGTVTLKALGSFYSRLDASSGSGTRSEIRNLSNGTPQGYWLAPTTAFNEMATQNTITDAAWFFPALSILSQLGNPNLIVSYVGPDTRAGVAVQHISLALQVPSDSTGLFQRLSAEDLYLDASTFLPVALTFNAHPDNDAGTNILVEVDFSNYQAASGVQTAFHVQKFVNGTLFLDLTIQSAVLNSGLTSSDFLPN